MRSKSENESALAAGWIEAATRLGLETVAPFSTTLPSGALVVAPILIKQVGAENGMVLVTEWADLRQVQHELASSGFGFSVMDEPRPGVSEILESYVDVLRDWGWAGNANDEPAWLQAK